MKKFANFARDISFGRLSADGMRLGICLKSVSAKTARLVGEKWFEPALDGFLAIQDLPGGLCTINIWGKAREPLAQV